MGIGRVISLLCLGGLVMILGLFCYECAVEFDKTNSPEDYTSLLVAGYLALVLILVAAGIWLTPHMLEDEN